MTDAVVPGVEEAAAVEDLGEEAWGVEAAEGGLGVGAVGQAEGDDLAVAPRLGAEPGHGVFAVMAVGQVFDEGAIAVEAAAGVLDDHRVAVGGVIGGEVVGGGDGGVGGGVFAAALEVAAVGGAAEDDGEGAGALREADVGGEADAVAGGDVFGGEGMVAHGVRGGRKYFFFEKKNQKTFLTLRHALRVEHGANG